ncbi:helicase [Chromatiales bacterium (ex Bugula neritina AB1)]|nr:helicase [Chromatiales bacterium (ex Bugula neritina AB1)]
MAFVLGDHGPFADSKPGFRARTEQQQLATAIDTCIAESNILIGEAGTGVGKTFAYLVPALTCGKRVIISTGTRHLQDQLFHTDLPVVRRTLGRHPRVALLKGRANYVCKRRVERAMRNPALREPALSAQLAQIRNWSDQTSTGDISEVLDVPESSPVWGHVTSNDDFCSDHSPEDLGGCFVNKARKRAMDATIVVVNHHLFCADLALKEGSFGEILPDADVVVIDEAHQLPDTAAVFFGRRLSSRQLFDLARDSQAEFLTEAPDVTEIRDRSAALEKATRDFRLSLGIDQRRDAWAVVESKSAVSSALTHLQETLELLFEPLDIASVRGKGLESCRRRCLAHMEVLESYTDQRDEDYIHWFETYRTGFSLNLTPQNVAKPFSNALSQLKCSWVFTSATLAVNGSFEHFQNQLGIEDASEIQVDSPFDYKKNALLYLPANMPQPQQPGYDAAVLRVAAEVVDASEGRCFILFTSHRALELAAAEMRRSCRFPVLVQGQMPKRELVDAFQSMGNAVLLGTSSFWEGVDVRGSALSSVIIDKLPFASPGDPVLQARINGLKKNGINAFAEYQLPKAVLTLKQGVGRLIRDVNDRGVMVICDPRLQTKDYGSTFLNSLPGMRAVQKPHSVVQFFRQGDTAS